MRYFYWKDVGYLISVKSDTDLSKGHEYKILIDVEDPDEEGTISLSPPQKEWGGEWKEITGEEAFCIML